MSILLHVALVVMGLSLAEAAVGGGGSTSSDKFEFVFSSHPIFMEESVVSGAIANRFAHLSSDAARLRNI